ncbi:signal peptidase I [Halorhabdus sp. BNX81]|uniref:signal peptidase I n=1 Tax=Halorhabdus sp. BNX81 TaxID=2980181 RepID=UPI0023DD385A|nr:signal peptidase I [Halorhabdus sp. BNX81]WEL20377.1 Signal peptidase I [Halorhabdus sp. BNX81]
MHPADIDRRQLGTIAVVVAFLLVFGAVFVTTVPQLAGADHSYVVLSDSMSPSIDAGSVVFVSEVPTDSIEEGNVITYVASENADGTTRITHRVVDVETADGNRQFRTKGDANDEPDGQLVAASAVIGTVQFHIPLLGYVLNFASSTTGVIALVIVPAVLLGVSEAWSLYVDASNGGDERS